MNIALPQPRLGQQARQKAEQTYLLQPIDRHWHTWTWAECYDESLRMAGALQRLGLIPGDRVGILSKNCAHWIIADYAIILAGLVSVPIYPTANAKTIQYILKHSGAKACFIGKLEDAASQQAGIGNDIVTLRMPYPNFDCDHEWGELIAEKNDGFVIQERQADDLFTILYTSGSTGQPKGAMHTHAAFAFVGQQIAEHIGRNQNDRVLSYLPLSHCTERAYVEASSLYSNATLYFTESLATFMDDLKYTKPTLFGSVPRLWKLFQLGILEKLPQAKLNRLLRIPILNRVLKHKLKAGMGLEACEWFVSGSAPIAPALLEWWHKLDITIGEGWGMTETFAYGTQIVRHQSPRFGCISQALPGMEIKTASDGELLIRGPCLMTGYYQDPERTAESFDGNFLKTGDRGSIDAEGWIRITGRVKEIFKTTKGKYVAPVPIESLLAHDPLIEQACVVGSNLKQPVALIYLTAPGINDTEHLISQLKKTRQQVNQQLEPHERLDRIIVVHEAWSIENGLLTPTLKMKRELIEKKYLSLIDREDGPVLIEQP